jgi:hypothetical protein
MSGSFRPALAVLTTLAGLVVGGVGAGAPAAAADADPPRVVGVSFSRTSVAVSGLNVVPVTVAVRLTDESGVPAIDGYPDRYPFIYLRRVSGGEATVPAVLSRTSGTPRDGTWSATVNVPAIWDGRWQVSLVVAYDTENNRLEVDPRTLRFSPTLAVTGTSPPAVTLGFQPDPVVGNGGVAVTGRAYFPGTGAGIPHKPLSTGVDNTCAEGVPFNDIVTNSRGYYRKYFSSALSAPVVCVRLLGPTSSGQGPTFLAAAVGRPRIRYVVEAWPVRTPVPVGTRVAISGRVFPRATGQFVELQHWVAGTWRTVGRVRVHVSGRYTVLAIPRSPGNHRYRVYKRGNNGAPIFLGAVSPTLVLGARGR